MNAPGSHAPTIVVSEIFPPRIGGSGAWLDQIYRRAAQRSVVVLAGACDGDVDHDARVSSLIERTDLSCDEWTLMTRRGRHYLRAVHRTIDSAVRRHGADQIHCARVLPEGAAALVCSARRRVGLVCYVHGEDVELARTSRETRALVSLVLSRSDRLVCNSLNTRRMLEKHWRVRGERIRVLHPGVDTAVFAPSEDLRADRDALGWPEGMSILTASRLEARKGHDMLLEALPSVLERVPDIHYAIVGDGPERGPIMRRVAKLGIQEHVTLHGALDPEQLRRAYRACDLFVLPNRRIGSSVEGFGIVLIEAQASGVPVIAGASGGTSEALEDGSSGLLVNCAAAANLIDPIVELLCNPNRRAAMGRRARELAVERFSWDALTKRIESEIFL